MHAAAPVIQEESDRLAPVATGNAAVTSAGDLPCRWVIHAVGPIWGDGDEEASLRSAVRASLDRAAELGATFDRPARNLDRHLRLPQKGGHRYHRRSGSISGSTTTPSRSLTTVRFTAFDEPTAELFADAIRVQATFMPKSGILDPDFNPPKDPKLLNLIYLIKRFSGCATIPRRTDDF